MKDHEQLRELLTRAVPEAPEVRAEPLAAAGRRSKTRRLAGVTALGVAVVVAAAATVPQVLDGDDGAVDRPTTPASSTAPRSSPSADPFTTASCPPPDATTPGVLVPNPERVTAVRLCVDRAPSGARQMAVPADALVEGVPEFIDALSQLPRPDADRCGSLDYLAKPYRLVVVTGRMKMLVHAEFCRALAVGTHVVDGNGAFDAFAAALDRQRDRFAYAPPTAADGAELTCRTPLTTAPFRPDRDPVVAAVSCPPYDAGTTATPVTGARLDRLAEAWAATPPSVPNEYEDPEPCTLDDDGQPFLVARTALGDVVRLAGTDCERLVAASTTDPDVHWEVPVAFDDVAG